MISNANSDRDQDFIGSDAALLRAAARARETARRHGTKLVIWRDGKVCEVDPDEVPLPDVESPEGEAPLTSDS